MFLNLADDDVGNLDEEATSSGRKVDEYVATDSSSVLCGRVGAKVVADAATGEQG